METCTKIFIEDFNVDAYLGIYEGDDKIKTKLSATIEVWTSIDAVTLDRIESTISYEILADIVRASTHKHYHLLEYLAEHYFAEIFKEPRALKARIKLIKPKMFPEGLCGIDWVRERPQ
jgi:dihydroneopterin aldolase